MDANKEQNEVEKIINRLHSHPGVQVIATHEGRVVKSTLDSIQTPQISSIISNLINRSQGLVRDFDPDDELKIMRIRSKKHEIMVTDSYLN